VIEPSLAKFNAAMLVRRAAQLARQVEQEADPEAADHARGESLLRLLRGD
jgi:hypothetical protein